MAEPVTMLVASVAWMLPGAITGYLSARRFRRARVSPLRLDVERGRIEGCATLLDPRGCELRPLSRGGWWAHARGLQQLEGSTVLVEDDRRVEVELAGSVASVHPAARGQRPGLVWRPATGDLVSLSGRVFIEAPEAGYRSATQGVWRVRSRAPGALGITLLVRADA